MLLELGELRALGSDLTPRIQLLVDLLEDLVVRLPPIEASEPAVEVDL